MAVAIQRASKARELYEASSMVIGQEKARKLMASTLDRQWSVHLGLLPHSSPTLLSGRSGTGKTMTARIMCQHLGLPYAECDATRYTEGGYKGLDLPQMFIPLLESAARIRDAADPEEPPKELPPWVSSEKGSKAAVLKRDDLDEIIEIAQTGVIVLDEFDKWMLRMSHVTGQQDRAIQSELLKMIEGSIESVTDSDDAAGVSFDTSRVLIICAGAFVGLFQQVARRMHEDADEHHSTMLSETFADQIIPEDFEKFGLLPELTGRLARHIFTRPLRVGDLRAILTRPGGLIEEYRSRFESYGCEWAVGEDAEINLSQLATEHQTGARALDYVMAGKFEAALFEAAVAEVPSKVTLTPSMNKALVVPR